jgi:GDP-4-dehydro-6-deoxy-D-mannose reductase
MRALITGSCGFLGLNLVDYIKRNHGNWEIYGFDRKENMQHDYNFEKIDFNTNIDWKTKLKEIEPDLIFHLIGIVRGTNKEFFNTNTCSFFNFIEGIRESELESRMLVIGTAAQYGHVLDHENPINENRITKPVNIYGLTKDWQEKLALFYHKTYGIEVICTRPSSFIGKGVLPQLLSGYLIRRFTETEKKLDLEISNATDIRDYIDVRDLCSAIVKLQLDPSTNGEVFNISSNEPITNIDFIKLFEKVTGKEASVTYSDPDKEPLKIWLDNSKILEKNYFKVEHPLEDSIKWSLQ